MYGLALATLMFAVTPDAWGKKNVPVRHVPLYFGKRVAKELSSSKPAGLSSGLKAGTVQWSIPSWSHGLSFLCCSAEAGGARVGNGGRSVQACIRVCMFRV